MNRSLYFAENVGIGRFYLGTKDLRVGWNEIEIALDGVGSSLLDLFGILGPTAQGCAVEAGNNRNVHCFFGFANVIEIALGSGVEFAGLGKISE